MEDAIEKIVTFENKLSKQEYIKLNTSGTEFILILQWELMNEEYLSGS
jgi:hypothetical protein